MEPGCVVDALGRIVRALEAAARPAVLWSGGKDSTALLHLVRRVRPDIECIQWRLPWMRRKWEFHDMLAREWNLSVHDQLPAWAALCHGNNRVDIMEGYAIGSEAMVVARGTEPLDESEPWVCGLEWLTRPKAAATDFPWDVLLCGHKNGDIDPCSGPVPLQLDVLRAEGCAAVHYPLRWWSDEDVTDYHVAHAVPWDRNRYVFENVDCEMGNGECRKVLRTRADKRLNSDYYQACLRCIDKREGEFVVCPKNQLTVDNISGRCAEYLPRHDYCSLRSQNAKCEMGNGE
jgi:hypothetical protein